MPPNTSGYDDVYILSMPTFTWIKLYPTDGNVTGQYPHHSLSCNVISGAQMLIIGGTFPLSDACDAPAQWGTHNLDMGLQNAEKVPWQLFSPNLTSYVVPAPIINVVGGGPNGGAAKTAPAAGFDAPDLRLLMTRKANIAARTPTRPIPTATNPAGSGQGTSLGTNAIAGIAVGGVVALVLLLVGGYCLIRRYRRKRMGPPVNQYWTGGSGEPSMSMVNGRHPSDNGNVWHTPQSSVWTPSSPYSARAYLRQPNGAYIPQGEPAELSATGTGAWHGPDGVPPEIVSPHGSSAGYSGSGTVTSGGSGGGGINDLPAYKIDEQGRVWVPQVSLMQMSPGRGPQVMNGGFLDIHPGQQSPMYDQSFPRYPPRTYSPATPTSPPPLQQPSEPQELSTNPRADDESEDTGAERDSTGHHGQPQAQHQTYYHP
jgi:hypothetical protein